MLKVLCLPGYYTNKEFMEFQMKTFKKYFSKEVEFTIIDPPFTFSDQELLECDESLLKFCAKTKTKPLNWLTYTHISLGPGKLEEYLDKAVDFLVNYLKNSNLKFDGIFGFSQGGLILDYLFYKASLEENNEILKQLLPKFIMIASANYLGYRGDFGYWKRFDVPMVFLIGELDYFFLRNVLMTVFYNRPLVVFHKEGHKIPNLNDEDIDRIRNFFRGIKANMSKL